MVPLLKASTVDGDAARMCVNDVCCLVGMIHNDGDNLGCIVVSVWIIS